MKIRVIPEGRDGVWIPDKHSVIDFISSDINDNFHRITPTRSINFGCDVSKDELINAVKSSDNLAVLTGRALSNNLYHALSVITYNKLVMFDIGDIKLANLFISEADNKIIMFDIGDKKPTDLFISETENELT